MMTGKAAKA